MYLQNAMVEIFPERRKLLEKQKEGKKTNASGWKRRDSTESIYECIKIRRRLSCCDSNKEK